MQVVNILATCASWFLTPASEMMMIIIARVFFRKLDLKAPHGEGLVTTTDKDN